ncbi:unnamed protein product [Alternaria alternata]
MYPLGQKLQEKLLNPVPRSRHNPTGTATRDPQPKARPLSVPLFSQGDLVHRPSGAASLRWSSSSLKTAQSVADGYTKEVRDFNIARGTAEKIEQTKDSFVKQRHAQPDSGTFTAVVLAQRWLGRLRLQDPHPMTRKLQQASQTSYRQQKFIPESQIRDIVRDEVIQAELSKSNKSVGKPSRMLKAPVVSKNYESYRKILAILYLMKRPSKIRLFVKAGLCDDQLPFKKAQHLGRFDRSATLTSRNTPGSANIKFTRPEDADEFLDRQWTETDRHHATYTGSANADRSTRNLFGRHGDLKPQNILWYPDSQTTGGHGVLKITDFGVTRFNTENMWDTQKTGKLPNSPTYRSPESDLDGKLTTACDVWALGCVYLEFVAWYFGGYRLVQRFGEQRLAPDPRMANMRTDTFFTIVEREGEKTADVKPAVLKPDNE